MKISAAFPSSYLKASDLQGRNATVQIANVNMEDIGGDHKPVLYFKGKEKGMVLNKTNANNIVAAYGDDTDNWTGRELVLYSTWVDFQGKSVEAVRCRAPQPKDMAQGAQGVQAPPTNGNGAPAGDEFGPIPNGNDMADEIPF